MKSIYTIADVGQAHEGSASVAHAYIDALADSGINAVKFQMHIADAESSIYENFRVKQPFTESSRMEYWRKMEFSVEEWAALKKHCADRKVDFIISPFSVAAVRLATRLGVGRFKIGSAEADDFLILQRVSLSSKNIILSSGMSNFRELDHATAFLKSRQCELAILQCTTAYPAAPAQWGLNVIQELQMRYQLPTGFSDHSGDIFACLAAASLGAELLEFHVIFDKRMPCPDASASLTLAQIDQLIAGIGQIEAALNSPVDKSDNAAFHDLKFLFGKSLAVNKSLSRGHRLTLADLESKKPAGCGIPSRQFDQVLGKCLKTDLHQWDFLQNSYLQ